MMERGSRCGTEGATEASTGLVLCHLKGLNQAFLFDVSEPNGRTVRENRKNYREVDFTPISKVQAPNRVAEDPQGR
jgi:hypothetical protein